MVVRSVEAVVVGSDVVGKSGDEVGESVRDGVEVGRGLTSTVRVGVVLDRIWSSVTHQDALIVSLADGQSAKVGQGNPVTSAVEVGNIIDRLSSVLVASSVQEEDEVVLSEPSSPTS